MRCAAAAPKGETVARLAARIGRPASAAQIAEELTHSRAPHPAPVTRLVPEQAPHGVGPAPTSADQVPTSWTESGGVTQEVADTRDTQHP